MMRALPPLCVHTSPAPATSGHVSGGGSWRCWSQAGSQPQGRPPPSSAREEGPSAQSLGFWRPCLRRRSSAWAHMRPPSPPPLLQPLPWPPCDPRSLLPPCVLGIAPDGLAEARSEQPWALQGQEPSSSKLAAPGAACWRWVGPGLPKQCANGFTAGPLGKDPEVLGG